MRSRVKLRAFRAGLVLASTFLALALVEAALRIMIPVSRPEFFAYDAQSKRSRIMKSGYEGICHGVPFALNQNGFRDAAPRVCFTPKAKGEFRVMVLGDSMTVCAGVPWETLYTTRLQELLQQSLPPSASTQVRVFNLAVGGYNIVHYRHTLQEVGLGLEPDLILVANYVHNDFQMADYRRFEDAAQGRIEDSTQTPRQPLHLELVVGPQIWRARTAISGWFQSEQPAAGVPPGPSFGRGSDGWEENLRAMDDIAQLARTGRIPLKVILLPHPSNFAGQTDRHNLVAQTWKARGVTCDDTLPAFIAAGADPRLYRLNLIDAHPNARYNALVADVVARIIRKDPRLRQRLQS
jgi:hypothetical protein